MGWNVGASSWDDPIRVPQRWRQMWREMHGWSCMDVASSCALVKSTMRGARPQAPLVARWENQTATPSDEQLETWLRCLDMMVDRPRRAKMRWLAYECALIDGLGAPPRPRDRVWLTFEKFVREQFPVYANVDLTRDVVLGKGVDEIMTL